MCTLRCGTRLRDHRSRHEDPAYRGPRPPEGRYHDLERGDALCVQPPNESVQTEERELSVLSAANDVGYMNYWDIIWQRDMSRGK